MSITRGTRKNIADWLRVEGVRWSGRLDDVDFLDRVFELDDMASTDYRFGSARSDIWQHRVNNYDWPDDWVYSYAPFELLTGPDERFLRFLSEMLHPVARPDTAEARRLAAQLNDFLREDGFELYESSKIGDKPVWSARQRSLTGVQGLPSLRTARKIFDADYIAQQITRMEAAVDPDPALAIGTAKELLETTCKEILAARDIAVPRSADLPKLVRMVAEELQLVPESVSDSARAADSIRRILGSLGTVAGGIAELRNSYGTGHGQRAMRGGLSPRHARLAVGSASALAVFLWETHVLRAETDAPVERAVSRG